MFFPVRLVEKLDHPFDPVLELLRSLREIRNSGGPVAKFGL